MRSNKPFRAAPLNRRNHYRDQQQSSDQTAAFKFLGAAAILGGIVGAGSLAFSEDGRAKIGTVVKPVAVRAELVRARAPQPGDVWGGCNDARAAGTAPIYAGEPGYRQGMDGDGDGIACEPYR
ncbi:excalibur calcium-binding domain-containing protein [Sphingomonas glacialis]|uniref:Excalibur calcium-binding domain-containing protein n=1 Tax=Sphingomonas glacialis TaxID=658225 RepID=A0A502FCH5_9SPHN|nr:excalibur calcium-binding domain-containing protein [Sphingomonas glacialis]TPG47011.1 hypothetical protein EAH76_22905 [Sphingomonas glacialis]